MNAKTQIIVLLFSYFFGFLFYLLSQLNNKIIKNQKRIYRSSISILFMCNIVLIYIISIYKLNNGKFHIYFFLMLILGFYSEHKLIHKFLNNVKYQSLLEKIKKKCYTKKNKGWHFWKEKLLKKKKEDYYLFL